MASGVRKRVCISLILLSLAIIIDQVIKIAVKTNMSLGEGLVVFDDWFQIKFVENNGMAFGMEIFNKYFLTSFRMVAVVFIIYYLLKLLRDSAKPLGYVVCITLVLAGAIGNLIDCLFYGEIFSSSIGQVAEYVPWGEGYSTFMNGHVVDMFYFPLFTWPDWLPLVGGDIFFGPVFNFADACVSCSVAAILLFYRNIFMK